MKISKGSGYILIAVLLLFSFIIPFTRVRGSSQLIYSSYLSGSNDTAEGNGIAVDTAGNIYIVGNTVAENFPTTNKGYERTLQGSQAVFVSKINPNLSGATTLVYSTYLSGSGNDYGQGIAVDSTGNLSVTGYTSSTDFPVTSNALETTFSGNQAVFISKINPTLSGASSLLYSTFLGGGSNDEGYGIALDNTGNIYVTGYTSSSTFPMTPNAYDSTLHGSQGVFVSEINPSLSGISSLIYSSLLSGENTDWAYGVAVDSGENIYVTGYTSSSTFPTTSNAYDKINQGNNDVIMFKLNPSLSGSSSLVYSTFLGGSGIDFGNAIAVDAQGNAYITGNTFSSDFPLTPNAYDTIFHGVLNQVFISEINPSLSGVSSLVYSTIIAGIDGSSGGNGITVDTSGMVYVTGYTFSPTFPTTSNAYDATLAGLGIAFISVLNPNLSGTQSLVYSTMLGGSNFSDYEVGNGIAIDNTGNIYVTGFTQSSDFPTTSNAFGKSLKGHQDIFMTKLQLPPPVPVKDWMLYSTEGINKKEKLP